MKKSRNIAQKILNTHLVEGEMIAGKEIGLKVDQTLLQDATGTLVMLELEAMGIKRIKTEVSVQYVDHNLIQEDYKNADDHIFLQTASQRFGLWYSRAGNGVSHPLHMQNFGIPGKILLGSDSHTCASGAIGMLSMGAGGMEVALAMAGHPYHINMPKIWGIELVGELPEWVSAKDIILEILRRYDVDGGIGYIVEYFGSGLKQLSAMDRHVIANMGAELGATSTLFPSDNVTKKFFKNQLRLEQWMPLQADKRCDYDRVETINLSELVPLIALPSSPGKVVPVREVAGKEIYQAYIGSSANPGFRDFAISAEMVKGKQVHPKVSYDINPSARSILEELIAEGHIINMIHAGARMHQAGCNGCIGMGQAPATGRNSLRTVPRNFPGRSGTKEDSVFLCSPETATASALTGKITDPRDLKMSYPAIKPPKKTINIKSLIQPPLIEAEAINIELVKGPNIATLPALIPVLNSIQVPVLLKLGDNISTDEIMPAGARVLPFRSNIQEISKFCFDIIDNHYYKKALAQKDLGGHAIVAGENYGQGSSREHAALAPRYLGLHVVIAKDFARIHQQNLVNFGILPLKFKNLEDYEKIEDNDIIEINDVHQALNEDTTITATIHRKNLKFTLKHDLSERQRKILLMGGLINWVKNSA